MPPYFKNRPASWKKQRNCSEPVLNSYASGDASHPESPDAT